MDGWTNERTDPEENWDIELRETEDGEEVTIRPKEEGGEAAKEAAPLPKGGAPTLTAG